MDEHNQPDGRLADYVHEARIKPTTGQLPT